MRLSIYFLTFVFLSSCTTIEVGREVVKVGAVVKDKVEETITKKEPEIIEDKTIIEEQQIITEEKEEEKKNLSNISVAWAHLQYIKGVYKKSRRLTV